MGVPRAFLAAAHGDPGPHIVRIERRGLLFEVALRRHMRLLGA